MSKGLVAWILVIMVAAAVGIRGYHLSERSIWFDEAFSWRLTNVSFTEMVQRTARDVHPPLYYLVLKTWTVVFDHSAVALRSLSITVAAASILLVYAVASYGFRSQTIGLMSAALMAASGWQIALSQEARMYMLATAITLLSVWLLLHAVRSSTQRLWWWILYGLSVAALAYTHYYGFFTIMAEGLWLLGYVIAMTRGRVGEILQWRLFWYALVAYVLSFLLFLPWLPTFMAQQKQVQQSFWIPAIDRWSVPDSFYHMLRPVVYGPAHQTWLNVFVAVMPVTLLVVIWLWLLVRPATYDKKNGDVTWLMIAAIVIPFALSVTVSVIKQSVYQDRYFALTHPFTLMSLAVLLMSFKPALVRRVASGFVILCFMFATFQYAQQLNILAKPGVRGATASLVARYHANEPIIVSSPFIFFSVDHYLTESFNLGSHAKLYSETGELAHFAGGPILNPTDVVKPDIFKSSAPSVWVVDTTGFGGSELKVPSQWKPESREVFPEVFGYQGDIIVNHYVRN